MYGQAVAGGQWCTSGCKTRTHQLFISSIPPPKASLHLPLPSGAFLYLHAAHCPSCLYLPFKPAFPLPVWISVCRQGLGVQGTDGSMPSRILSNSSRMHWLSGCQKLVACFNKNTVELSEPLMTKRFPPLDTPAYTCSCNSLQSAQTKLQLSSHSLPLCLQSKPFQHAFADRFPLANPVYLCMWLYVSPLHLSPGYFYFMEWVLGFSACSTQTRLLPLV